MLTLDNLATIRHSKELRRQMLAVMTGIDVQRLRDFETGRDRTEPWYDEALKLAQALDTTILDLITSGSLTASAFGPAMPGDVDLFRAGVRLPLSLACRVALKLGLEQPEMLQQHRIYQQIWSVIASNERGAEPGQCPWCLATIAAGDPHRPTCLPHNLMGLRRPDLVATPIATLPKPEKAGMRGTSGIAYSLAALRKQNGLTQRQLADAVGINPSYLARIERCEVPLTKVNATRMALLWGCDVLDLYRKSPEQAAQVSTHDDLDYAY